MLGSGKAFCRPANPCPESARCPQCEAEQNLTARDWEVIGFYRQVRSQYLNQTPMGAGKGQPPILTPRLEGWVPVLERLYPPERHAFLLEAGQTLHSLVTELDVVEWTREVGVQRSEVTLEAIQHAAS